MEAKLHRRDRRIFEMTQIGAGVKWSVCYLIACLLLNLGLAQDVTDEQQSEQSKPVLNKVASWPGYPRGPALDVALLDSYAYVAIGFGGVLILDVSNPADPKRVRDVDEVGYASLLEVHQDRLYVASKFHRGNRYGKEGYRGKLVILDLANPAHPTLMGSHILGTEIQSFDVQDTRILIGEGNHAWGHTEASLRLLDVSDAADIKTMDVLQLRNNHPYHFLSSPGVVAFNQERTYVSGYKANFGTVLINQISPSGKQSPLNTFVPNDNSLWPVHHIQVQDKLLYIAGHSLKEHKNVLDIWDLTNQDSPLKKGTVDILDDFYTLRDFAETEIADGKAILCMKQHGIQMIQIKDPTQPKVIDHFDTPGTALRVEMKDDILYIADFEGGLQIVKLQDSGKLQSIGNFDTGLTPGNLHIAGNRGFLLNQNKEPFLPNRPSYRWFIPGYIECIDLSDPTQPALLGRIDMPHFVEFFTSTETRLYVGWLNEGKATVTVYDVTNPATPIRLFEEVITKEGYDTSSVELLATHTPPRLYVSEKTIKKENRYPTNFTTIFDTSSNSILEQLDSFTRGGAIRDGMIIHNNLLIQNASPSDSLDMLMFIGRPSRDIYSYDGSFELPSREWGLQGRKRGGLDAADRYVYAGLSWNGFSIVDIEQHENPQNILHQPTDGEVLDLAVSDGHLYVAEGWKGLSVYDVTDPILPHQINNIPKRGPATNIEIANEHVFVVTQGNGLEIFEPITGFLSITTNPKSTRIKKGEHVRLNVGAIGPGTLTYQWFKGESGDTSHPILNAKKPSFITSPIDREEHYWAQVTWEKTQLASETVQVSPTPQVSVELIGRWPDTKEPIAREGFATDVAIWSDLVYMADGTDGIQILKVSDPATPIKVAHYPTFAKQLEIQGNDLFVSSGVFKIFSIQNPYEPRETYKTVYDTVTMLPMGPWTFLSTTSGFFTLDKSKPGKIPSMLPSRLISPVSEWRSKSMAVSGNIVAVGQNWGGIQLINVTQPDEPTFLSSYYPNASINRIAWKDSTIIATHGELYPGLETVDMSDPRHPRQMASIDLPKSEDVVIMDGSYACVTGKGLRVFDYGDPKQLVQVGSSDESEINTFGLEVHGNLAYVAAGDDGLLIYRITPQLKLNSPMVVGHQLRVTWMGANGVVLQESSNLEEAQWKDVQNSEGRDEVLIPLQQASRWYRLIKR